MFQRIEEGRKREMQEYAQKIVEARLDGEKNGRTLGARDNQISLLSRQFAKKFKTSPNVIEEIIALQSNEVLDNLGENIFSIDSISELKAFLKQH